MIKPQRSRRTQRRADRFVAPLCALCVLCGSLHAGGPFGVNSDGSPTRWNLDATILDASAPGLVPYRVDLGTLGEVSSAEVRGFVDRIFEVHESVPTSRVAFENVGPVLSPTPVLGPGTYHIAVANNGALAAEFAILANLDAPAAAATDVPGPVSPTLIPLTPGVALEEQTIPGGGGGDFFQLDPQFTVVVPPGAQMLSLAVTSETANLDLFIRRDAPVEEGDAGALVFDHASQAPGGIERFELRSEQVPIDITAAQVGWHIAPSPTGQNAIIFDEDGSLHETLFGQGTGVLGFFQNRAPDAAGFFTEGFVVLNGKFIDGNARNGELPVPAYRGVFTHEFGHFVGLDHSQINGEISRRGPGSAGLVGFDVHSNFDLFTPFVETMHPFIFADFNLTSDLASQGLSFSSFFTNDLALDDRIAVSALYSEPGFLTDPSTPTGGLAGQVLRADGLTPVSGVNVVVRRIDGPLGPSPFPPLEGTRSYTEFPIARDADGVPLPPAESAATDSLRTATSVVAGALGPDFGPPGPPVIGSGRFHFDGLPPGTYRLNVEEIDFASVGGSRIGPFNPQLEIPFEETWSGAGEGASEFVALPVNAQIINGGFETDDLAPYTSQAAEGDAPAPLIVEAGAVTDPIEIILDAPSPEGDVRRIGALGSTVPIQPPEGASQLILTTGEDFGAGITQRFLPPQGAEAIEFRMRFLTNEMTPDPDFNDRAILTAEAPPGQLDAVVLSDTAAEFASVHPSTGFAEGTPWRLVTMGDLDLLPPGEPLTLRWSVVDGWDDEIPSALLLDDIRTLATEPADIFASALPGLMSFRAWRPAFNSHFIPSATDGSTREAVTLATDLAAADVLGMWVSPPDALPWRPDSAYRLRFHLRSDQPDPSRNPLVRLRLFTANGKAWLTNRLESTPASLVTPTADGIVAEMWFEPPDLSSDQGDEVFDDMVIVFEVVDLSPAEGGEITLERVEADRFDHAALVAAATTARSFTEFDGGEVALADDLSLVGLLPPEIELLPGEARFTTPLETPEGAVGFHREIFGLPTVDAPPGSLVRAVFNLSSEGDVSRLPLIRPRLVVGSDLQLSGSLLIVSQGLGADPLGSAPCPLQEDGRDYTVLLRVPDDPGADGQAAWALGVLDLDDRLGGTFSVNRVDIQVIDPTLLAED